MWLWHQDNASLAEREADRWAVRKVITIPAEPADPQRLPPALKPFGAVPPLISDIDLSVDDRWLYVSCWGTGELKQYDVADPFNPRESGSAASWDTSIMRTTVDHRGEVRPAPAKGPVPAAIPVSVGLAWTGLLLAELLGAPISHDALAGGSLPLAAGLGIFGVAWVAMVVAMMLPSSYPVVRAFAATAAGQRDRSTCLLPFVAGYLAVWTAFGFVLFFGDLGIHALLDRSPAPGAFHATLISDALIVAGAFQLTERKRRCLSRCRRPPGRHGSRRALRLGLSHGLDCLGSGWALMLAVFALGSPEAVWMALFAGVMVYEKAGRHGLLAARLAGVALLAASVFAALS